MGSSSILLGGGLLAYPAYRKKLKAAISPEGLHKAKIEPSKRYPGPFPGSTIISDPLDPDHRNIYSGINYHTKVLIADIKGLSITPPDSYHLTLQGLLDPEMVAGGVSLDQAQRLRQEIINFIKAHNQLGWQPIKFTLSGYFLRVDAMVLGLMPKSEQDHDHLNCFRRDLAQGPVFRELGIGIGRPDIMHITTAYQTAVIFPEEMDRIRAGLINYNSSMSGEELIINRLYYTEFPDLDHFPRVVGSPDLVSR